MAAVYGRIGDQLRDHVNQAPTEVTESVLGPASKTARYCQIVDRENLRSGDYLPMVEKAVNSADRLQEKAEDTQRDVGIF